MEEKRSVIAEHFEIAGLDFEQTDFGTGCRARIKGSGLFFEYTVTAQQDGNSVQISVSLPVKVLRGEARAVLMGLMDINDALPESECFELDIMSGVVSFRRRESRTQWSECEVGQSIDYCMEKISDMAADIRKVLYGQHAARPDDVAQQGLEHRLNELSERVDELETLERRIDMLEAQFTVSAPGMGSRYGFDDDIPSPRHTPYSRARSHAAGGFRIKNPFRNRGASRDDDEDEEEYYDGYEGEEYDDIPSPGPRRSAPSGDGIEDEHLPSFLRRRHTDADDEASDDGDAPPMPPRRRAVPTPPTHSPGRYAHMDDDDDDPDENDPRARPRRR